MPSIKKAVYGIFRQLSSNSVAPSSNNGHASDETSDELLPSTSDSAVISKQTICDNNNSGSSFKLISEAQTEIYLSSSAASPQAREEFGVTNGVYSYIETKGDKISPTPVFRNSNDFFSSLNSKTNCQENGRRFSGMAQSFIHAYLSGRLKKPWQPEIYSGKTGVDLPVFQIVPLNPVVFASYSGPDGGLTQVPCVTRRPLANIANLDDELNLSYDADLDALSALTSTGVFPSPQAIRRVISDNNAPPHRTQSLNSNGELIAFPVSYETKLNWSEWNDRAYGLSTSLYECHPFTGVHAGTPIADVFAVCARQNSCVLALADGVNWGEKSRLAARCAIRGAIEHLDDSLYSEGKPVINTLDVFHALLGAFHTGHQLILQETGSLTTLCVVVLCQLKGDPQWIVCACNVGDSLAFVYSEKYGVREVTLGSHDIQQMRDMRDAGGALGPVDGVNPELHNMTCSMTTVDIGDIVFITSDGVSDNFDPVVGKFCVIRDENSKQTAQKPKDLHSDGENSKSASPKPPSGRKAVAIGSKKEKIDKEEDYLAKINAHLPVVEAYQRHELMLLRMEDLLRHGVTVGDGSIQTARHLCENLVNFATQLTTAKRKLLEDPELYQGENRLSQRDQRLRRRLVRQRISELPGKLDHATVVAYMVGERPVAATSTVDQEIESDKDSSRASTLQGKASRSGTSHQSETDKEDAVTIESNDAFESNDDNAAETPKVSRRGLPFIGATNSQPVAGSPISPSMETDDSELTICPALPTEPVPSSSSSDEETEWMEPVKTSRGPYEPKVGELLCADGSVTEIDWTLANKVRMIDETSVSSLSAIGSTPVPPPTFDSEELDEKLNVGVDDLETPAQEHPPAWPIIPIQGTQLDGVQAMPAQSDQQDTEKLNSEESELHVPENYEHKEAAINKELITTDKENEITDLSTELDHSLALDGCSSVNVDLDLHSLDNAYHTYGSVSISSVLECCNLIIRDTDNERTEKISSPASLSLVKSHDQLSQREPLTPLDENDVVDIFTAHGVPPSARRWPPPTNRTAMDKCASLPLGGSIDEKLNSDAESDGQNELRGQRRFSDMRSQRSLMNESYYMATALDDQSLQLDASTSTTNTIERGAAKTNSGKLGKLSKAFDRLERVIPGRRKHRRGSPSRHTVATDSSQWSDMKEKAAEAPHSSRVEAKTGNQTDVPQSPSKRFGTSPMHLAWSPVRAFRALTSPRRQSSVQTLEKNKTEMAANGNGLRHSLGRKTKNKQTQLKVNIIDTTADVFINITDHPTPHSVQESATFVIPHSASDTEIVATIIRAPTKDDGKESDV